MYSHTHKASSANLSCTLFALLAILLTLEGITAQAPGDETFECIDPDGDQFTPPPVNRRVLMDSSYYELLLPDSNSPGTADRAVWSSVDSDGDGSKVSCLQ